MLLCYNILFYCFNFSFASLVFIPMDTKIETVYPNSFLFDNKTLIPILIFFTIGLVMSLLKLNSIIKKPENNSEIDSEKREYQLYLLFLGFIIPFIEIIFEIYHVRPKSLLINNLFIGMFFLALFLASEKSTYLYKRIQNIYIVLFLLYFLLICYNIVFLPEDTVPTYAFLVTFFFSYI